MAKLTKLFKRDYGRHQDAIRQAENQRKYKDYKKVRVIPTKYRNGKAVRWNVFVER